MNDTWIIERKGEKFEVSPPPGLRLDGFHKGLPVLRHADATSIDNSRPPISSIIDYEKTNEEVERLFRRKWLNNASRNAKNYPSMTGEFGLRQFQGKLKNKTCALIGAGPSLDKNIGELKDAGVTTIAMLHSLTSCYKHGVYPDFVVHSDAMATDKIYIKPESKYSTLIANVIVAPSVIRAWKGPVVFYRGMRTSDLTRKVDEMVSADVSIRPMGCSMAAAMFIADMIFDAKVMIFVGNDLAYSETGATHCEDDSGVDNHLVAGVRTITIENERTGIQHNTCYQFILYKQNLEGYVHHRMDVNNSGKVFINGTEGGVLLSNRSMTLNQALKEAVNVTGN